MNFPSQFRPTLWVALVGAGLASIPLRVEARQQEALVSADQAASQLSSDSGLSTVLARTLSPNGPFLWPGAPAVLGPDRARRVLEALPGGDSLRLTWQPLGAQLSDDSAMAVSWGIAVATSRVVPAAPQLGRYMAVWQRAQDKWTIAALLFTGLKPTLNVPPPDLPLTLPAAKSRGPAGPFLAADLAFAQLARDSGAAVAFERWAATDAAVFGGNGLITRGPQAIGRGVAGPSRWQWHPVAAGAARTGDLGWTVGEAVISPDKGQPFYSKYLTVWKRDRSGRIRFLTDGGNSRPATR